MCVFQINVRVYRFEQTYRGNEIRGIGEEQLATLRTITLFQERRV